MAVAATVMLCASIASADIIVTAGLSLHYRADNVDGFGNAGNSTTTTLVNLANPGVNNGTIAVVTGLGSGVTQNVAQVGTPFEYGVVLTGDLSTKSHISTDYRIGGGVNKVTSATWEFWLRADSGATQNRGALYGEFADSTVDHARHFLRLQGINTATRNALYDEFTPSGGSATSDAGLFDTATFAQIVVTKNGDTLTFYQNGVQVGATKSSSETYTGNAITRTLFGLRGGSPNNESFTGQFNIIRMYDSVLTSDQVLQNYNATVNPIPEPSSFALLALGGTALATVRRRRR